MGIRGLTTFIQNRSHLYLEEYELHDSNIVIDGNSIACQLYKWHCKSNDCFGGDYDLYGGVIENFFHILSSSNVTPYVVFDGGYESRKIATVINRMKNKVKSAEQLTSATEGSISVFPLFLRETFLDIVLKLNIKCVRCDFESDTEVANIARTLNCPVLSYDSDFFIFDVLYIPFVTFEMCTRKKKCLSNESYTYINCQVYRVEKFLKTFGGLDKSNLPILAVLLGNDYVKRSVFSLFFNHLKIQKCHGNQNEQQKRIKSVIVWLQNESTESAIQKVLSRYKCKRRKLIAKKIHNAMKGYNCTCSIYLQYLRIAPIYSKDVLTESVEKYLDIDNCATDADIEENLECAEDISSSDEEEEETSSINENIFLNIDKEKFSVDLSTVFLEKYRKCLYPPSFMDILTQSRYYCIPQVENDSLEYSHAICSEILSAIHDILRSSEDNLVCIARNTNGHIKKHSLSCCHINVPSLEEIQSMSITARKCLFIQVLKINDDFLNCINLFPESWHLFIFAIKYFLDKSNFTWPIVYALILCKIFLSSVDKNIGMCRSKKALEKKFSKFVASPSFSENTNASANITVIQSINSINFNDSLNCSKKLMPYFHLDLKMKINDRLFNRNILHSMAQFQSCLLHIKYLNNNLNMPFPNFIMSEIFNGTFVYNLSVNFMKRSNLNHYITLLLQDSPTVLTSVLLVVEKLKEHCDSNINYEGPSRRKKKKTKKEINVNDYKQHSSEEEAVYDTNNKYSILIFSEKNC